MSKRYQLVLNVEECEKLDRWLKKPPKPYLRERARATLLIADGKEGQQVAGELRVRVRQTTIMLKSS